MDLLCRNTLKTYNAGVLTLLFYQVCFLMTCLSFQVRNTIYNPENIRVPFVASSLRHIIDKRVVLI